MLDTTSYFELPCSFCEVFSPQFTKFAKGIEAVSVLALKAKSQYGSCGFEEQRLASKSRIAEFALKKTAIPFL